MAYHHNAAYGLRSAFRTIRWYNWLMANYKYSDVFFATLSWLIAIALLFSMAMLWVVAPSGMGPVAQVIGVQGAQIFYTALYGTEALVLIYSKLFKKKNLRRYALMSIYLTAIFTGILTISLGAPLSGFIDNLILVGLTGACWLYWQFKTKYVEVKAFRHEIVALRTDPDNPLDDPR